MKYSVKWETRIEIPDAYMAEYIHGDDIIKHHGVMVGVNVSNAVVIENNKIVMIPYRDITIIRDLENIE